MIRRGFAPRVSSRAGRRSGLARGRDGGRPRALPASRGADLALFHEFAPSPTGGGHQFLRALVGELERRGLESSSTASREAHRSASSTRSTSTSVGSGGLRARLPDGAPRGRPDRPLPWLRRRHRRPNRRGGPRACRRDDRPVAASASTPTAASGSTSSNHGRFTNAVDPAVFHPPGARKPLARPRAAPRCDELVGQPEQGRRLFTWLDRHSRLGPLRAHLRTACAERFERIRSLGPLDLDRARGRAAPPRRLPRRERQRPLLERFSSRRSPSAFRPSTAPSGGTRARGRCRPAVR